MGFLVIPSLGAGSTHASEDTSLADLIETANERTDEVVRMQRLAQRTMTHWVAGGGLGFGIGLVVSGTIAYAWQRRKIDDKYT